jgi:hypothetical protein
LFLILVSGDVEAFGHQSGSGIGIKLFAHLLPEAAVIVVG